MKILIVASNMVHIKNFHAPYVNELRSMGHEVYVMANGDGADFNIPFEKRAFSLKNMFLVSKIKKILKRENFDAVLLHTTLAAFWTRKAIKGLKNRPYVINTVHGYLFNENTSKLKRKIYLLCEKSVASVTDNILVMNKEDMAIATKYDLSKGPVYEINGMGVNFDRIFTSEAKEKAPDEMINLLFIGEISKRKNQEFLCKALQKLPNYRLILVGDGDERERVEALARKIGVTDRLEITGFTNDISKYLKEADIYVSASKIEGLPFNIMEAMYASLPIVASNVKGNADLLSEKSLYPYNDADEFVNKVKSTPLGIVKYDMEKYDIKTVLQENIELYVSLINNK